MTFLPATYQERLELERKEKKRQKEKERKDRLKKLGKLLTKSQREARARAEATLKLLQAQGEMPTFIAALPLVFRPGNPNE